MNDIPACVINQMINATHRGIKIKWKNVITATPMTTIDRSTTDTHHPTRRVIPQTNMVVEVLARHERMRILLPTETMIMIVMVVFRQ